MLRFAAHPVHAYSTGGTLHPAPAGLPCSMNWFSLFPPENSLFDQTNSLFRGVGNSKLKPHDISGLGGFDPAYSRPNLRNSLFFPCKTGKSGQRRVRTRLPPPPRPYISDIATFFVDLVPVFPPKSRALADALVRGFGWQRRFCVALAYRFHTPVSQALFSGTGFEGVIG